MGVKERRTKLLLTLFFLSDVSFDYSHLNETVQKAFDFSFNQKTKTTMTGLSKEGLVEKNKDKEESYRLTDKGFQSLCFEFPAFRFMKETWDAKWRVISYEIPESKRELRDRLRREMQGWGLGPWHRSFWLTPHPVMNQLKDLVGGKQEEQYIQAFESIHVFGNRDGLIEKVWGKSALDKAYREMFKKWHDILSKEGDKGEKMAHVINEYINLLRQDPGLPKELMGEKWIGFEAFNIFKEIRSILLS